jgi:tRNA nucleotidyltransferase (CCA-adding enzyme)
MDLITTHKNTDFDALASVIAGTLVYPGAIGVIPKSMNKNIKQFLSTHKTAFNIILPQDYDPEEISRLIIMDTNQWRRIDRMEPLRQKDIPLHLWDHHTQEGDIIGNWQCIEAVGATTTLLVRELQRRKIRLTPLHSTLLLIGIYEDTGHLTYPSTCPADAAAAAYLLSCGADLNIASFFLNPPYEETQKTILLQLLENTEKFTHKKVTIAINVIALEQKVSMLSSIVTMYRKLTNTDAVFIIFINDENCCTIIARSGNERVHVGAILSQMGGGGHQGAASVTLRRPLLDGQKIKEELRELIYKDSTPQRMTVAELMSTPVVIVSAETKMKRVREIMEDHSIRGVLVGTEENLEGIIVITDMKKLKSERQWKSPVKAFMARKPLTITPDTDPTDAAAIMTENDIGHLPVQQGGKTIGILTRTDILTYFYDMDRKEGHA